MSLSIEFFLQRGSLPEDLSFERFFMSGECRGGSLRGCHSTPLLSGALFSQSALFTKFVSFDPIHQMTQ